MAVPVQRLTHIALHVGDSERLARDLMQRFCFQLYGRRVTERARQLVLRRGSAVFMVNESRGGEPEAGGLLYDVAPGPGVDSACNVSFQVKDVERAALLLERLGCRVLVPPRPVEDELGWVRYSVVRSVVGNVSHTLVQRGSYRGEFLPGFGPPPEQEAACRPGAITHFDHITYACPRRQSAGIMDWYRRCFGFQRFLINRSEDLDDGYIIEGNNQGMRLAAMEYWKCSEVAMSMPMSEDKKVNCKFVLAESLPNLGKNQIDTFLEQHHGAGIQHVGLYTTDIVSTCKSLTDAGVQFFYPPSGYYTEREKWQEIMKAGQDPELLSHYGILLDSEVDDVHCKEETKCQGPSKSHEYRTATGDLGVAQYRLQYHNVFSLTVEKMGIKGFFSTLKYLMQMFTKPIFSEETLFLELIERRNASGFGAGNIRALWKSVQACMDQEKKKKISARNGFAHDVNS